MKNYLDDSQMEMTIDIGQCAEIALYMYKEWEEAMKPPLFIYKTFPEWLEQLVKEVKS